MIQDRNANSMSLEVENYRTFCKLPLFLIAKNPGLYSFNVWKGVWNVCLHHIHSCHYSELNRSCCPYVRSLSTAFCSFTYCSLSYGACNGVVCNCSVKTSYHVNRALAPTAWRLLLTHSIRHKTLFERMEQIPGKVDWCVWMWQQRAWVTCELMWPNLLFWHFVFMS